MKKPLSKLILNFIYGIDEKGLEDIGLYRNSYRALAGLYIIKNIYLPKKEIAEIKKALLKIVLNERGDILDIEVKKYAQKVYDDLKKDEKTPKILFHNLIINFIYGIDEKGLEDTGLLRNNYRIFAGLYLINNTDSSEKEIAKYRTELKKMRLNKKFSHEIRNYIKKVIKNIETK